MDSVAFGRGPIESDIDYFTRRASEERRAAMTAVHPDARDAHQQMAARYAELAAAIQAHAALLGLGSAEEAAGDGRP